MSKKKSDTPQKLTGAAGFDTYYASLFNERWLPLKQSLVGETQYVELSLGGVEHYFLDPASVCAALCLPVAGAQKLLDLCAAPGGKTLVIASVMEQDARLYSNERSPDRKSRLVRVIQQNLPESISSRIIASCSDGATWCRRESECYDSILLDAPCSSERHVLTDPKYLNEWSPSRIKSLAMEQWALLSSAFRLLAPGGHLVYATCALSPQENDEVIERLLKKFSTAKIASEEKRADTFTMNAGTFAPRCIIPAENGNADTPLSFITSVYQSAEKTNFGCHVLPDSSNGYGPLYFSLIEKQ